MAKKPIKTGVFVSIEGGEGCGKSTFRDGLVAHLTTIGVASKTTREPGGTPMADAIRSVFNHVPPDDPPTPICEAFLLNAARAQHCDHIRKWLEDSWVVCDRFADSTRVYQCALGDLDRKKAENLIEMATGGLAPHLTFLLDCPVEVAMERVQSRSDNDGDGASRYDQAAIDVYRTIRRGFLDLADESSRIVVLDATKSREDLVRRAVGCLQEREYLP